MVRNCNSYWEIFRHVTGQSCPLQTLSTCLVIVTLHCIPLSGKLCNLLSNAEYLSFFFFFARFKITAITTHVTEKIYNFVWFFFCFSLQLSKFSVSLSMCHITSTSASSCKVLFSFQHSYQAATQLIKH